MHVDVTMGRPRRLSTSRAVLSIRRSSSATSPSGRDLPAFGDRAEVGVDEGDVLVAGEPEVDEPLPVDRPSHLLQQLDPPPVVLDQVIDRAEDRGDRSLRRRDRHRHGELA